MSAVISSSSGFSSMVGSPVSGAKRVRLINPDPSELGFIRMFENNSNASIEHRLTGELF
jgi:hypothetical protein